MEHTGFPSDETLAAFLDGNLDPDTRRRVIEHMTTCEECYSVVAVGTGIVEQSAEPASPKRSSPRRPGMARRLAAAAALAVVASRFPLYLVWSRTESHRAACLAH